METLHYGILGNENEVSDYEAMIGPGGAGAPAARPLRTAGELTTSPDIDTVVVAPSWPCIRETLILAAEAGKNIICENPALMSVHDLDEVISAVEAGGVHFQIFQRARYHADYRTAQAILRDGSLGQLYSFKLCEYSEARKADDSFSGGGTGRFYRQMVSLLDQVLTLVHGKIISVYADIKDVAGKRSNDYGLVLIRYDNGATATIETGNGLSVDSAGSLYRKWFIGGRKGSVYMDGPEPSGRIVRMKQADAYAGELAFGGSQLPRRSAGTGKGRVHLEPLPGVEVHPEAYFQHYRKALAGEEPFDNSVPEYRRELKLVEAIHESAISAQTRQFE